MSISVTASRSAGLIARFASALKAVPRAVWAAAVPGGASRVSLEDAPGGVSRAEPSPGRASRAEPSPGGQFRRRHEDALAVLSATRGVIARGWVQNTWYVVETPAGPRSIRQRFLPGRFDRRRVVGACLIGAVVHGAWQLSPRPEYAYPAIDALWHTLFDADATWDADPVGPMTPPLVRAARVRDLTTWNDRGHRAKDEVLRLLDLTTARVSARRDAAVGA
ncbi:hypothetical protein ACFQS1_17715 [Paractinoplanes rhizophilus]|uniref:Uncharacterized protein n=1 Tax=Paractinoplanes rhizophilus TaxID=1416877 RepID=A0ABW2HVL4_9ACTN|nr:hypothetical protein [Actinoplanes sp.]